MTFPTPQALTRMFPDTATVQMRSVSYDGEGGEEETWSTRHSDIACQFSAFFPASAPQSELRGGSSITTLVEPRAILLGDFPGIVETDRVLLRDSTFDITGIERDSWQIVTSLRLQERSP